MKPKHNGLIIALLVLSAISIIPPIDAFTVSKNNQIGFLERKLLENDMLVDNAIVPKSDVSIGDKIVITKVASYIDNMGYNKKRWPTCRATSMSTVISAIPTDLT